MPKVDVRRPLGIGHLNPKGESDDSAVFDGDIGHIIGVNTKIVGIGSCGDKFDIHLDL